ncbi:MAG TPA: PilZ domain-containing protein [Patescibacteria group bacterium]|nr:PilZ domain-containing protein [Patescibacteria group bacterium]
MNLVKGQLLIILAPFIDYEIYANINQLSDEGIMLELKADMEVPIDKEILCIVVDEANMFEFYTKVTAKNEKFIFIKQPKDSEFNAIEKRKFNRVDCNIGFVATPVSINNISIHNSDKKFTGVIKNISGGGVLIESNLNLPVNMTFNFKLKLNFFLDCKAKVVRTDATDKTIYHSGCQFIESTLDTIKNISLYCFKEKLRQKRKELNNRKPE